MRTAWWGIGVCGLFVAACLTVGLAQETGKSKTTGKTSKSSKSKKAANTPALDVQANQLQSEFIDSASSLANDYYEAGNYDKAKTLLRTILTLNPEQANVAAKLKLLEEELLNSNANEIDVDPSSGWVSTGYVAIEGKPIRFKAEGSFKFSVTMPLGPKGYAPANSPTEYVTDQPPGALIGIILPLETDAANPRNRQPREIKEKAFLIGEGIDHTPQKGGMLFLRINTPLENKNTGKVKVQISGQAQRVGG